MPAQNPTALVESPTRTNQRRFTPSEIERGLTVYALCGSSEVAAKQLAETDIPIKAQTLRDWTSRRHRDLWNRIRTEQAPRIQAQIAAECERNAQLAGEIQRKALHKTEQTLEQLKTPHQAISVAQRAAITGAVNLDKALALRGQPTQIIEHRRSPEEIWAELKALGISIDSTAEEDSSETET
jgi:hypothetical protein